MLATRLKELKEKLKDLLPREESPKSVKSLESRTMTCSITRVMDLSTQISSVRLHFLTSNGMTLSMNISMIQT